MRLSLEQLPSCKPGFSPGLQRWPTAPVPGFDFSWCLRVSTHQSRGSLPAGWPPPSSWDEVGSQLSSKHPLPCKDQGAAALVSVPAGASPWPCIKPLIFEEEQGQHITKTTSHPSGSPRLTRLPPIWGAPASGPCSSPAHSGAEALLALGTRCPARPRSTDRHGEGFRASCLSCTPGAAPQGPRDVGTCPGSLQDPPPATAHHIEGIVGGVFLPSNE